MLKWLRTLDVSVLNAEVTSSFPSIRRTLQHMCNAQHFWYSIISETQHSGDVEFINVEGAFNALISVSEKIVNDFSKLMKLI